MKNSSAASLEHMQFMHGSASGWITMAQKDPHTKKFRQYHYTPEEIAAHLSEWSGENIYFSQNTFYRPKRSIDTIKELRSIYVDLDCYNLGLKPEYVLGKLEYENFGQNVPDPNMTIMSGRGLVLVWNIEPVPYMALPLWKSIENHFINILKDLGADSKCSDPTRIFRLAGSINSKNGALVRADYRHNYRYALRELQYEYLPELTPRKTKEPAKRGRKAKVVHMFNVYTLHLARTRDIRKLIELREGDVGNCRETMCFLYRYWTCCYSDDPQRALEDTIDLNLEFKYPLSHNEVVKATKSAEKAWAAKSNAAADKIAKELGYLGAGYNLKNQTIIDWLDISEEEQEHLSTIIGPKEKRTRNAKAMKSKRRSEGAVERQVYLDQEKQKKLTKVDQLRAILAANHQLTNKELAEEMNCTVRTIQRLKKDL